MTKDCRNIKSWFKEKLAHVCKADSLSQLAIRALVFRLIMIADFTLLCAHC